MILHTTPIEGVRLIEAEPFADHRGQFSRLYCERELSGVLDGRRIVQVNLSRTREVGALRGLHYQAPPHAEMKFIRCVKGRVFDVAVDLRENSATFLRWFGYELTPASNRALVIPEGCAHGFQVLEEDSELLYLHTQFYEKETECGVRYNDPALAIEWPLPVSDISARDQSHPLLSDNFKGIQV